jgi:hypothetical protein
LLFEFSDPLLEHSSTNWRGGGREITPGLCQGQFDGVASSRAIALSRRQRSTRPASAPGFGLLKLDVFALETSSHGPQNIRSA